MPKSSSEDYAQKLKDPRWQKKRLEILSRDHWRCSSCLTDEKTLHIHHLFYFKGKNPWEINNGFLITLCEDCHKQITTEDEVSPHDSAVEAIGDIFDALLRKDIAMEFVPQFLDGIKKSKSAYPIDSISIKIKEWVYKKNG